MCLSCAACACCAVCSCCKCTVPRKLTNLIYMLFMFTAVAVGLFFRFYGHELFVDLWVVEAGCDTDRCYGIMAVYRMSFAIFLFFLILAFLVLINPVIHRGFWAFKFLVMVSMCIITFFIDNSFFEGYANFSRVASFLFLIVEVLVLIDFSYDLHEWWIHEAQAKDEEDEAAGDEVGMCNRWKALYLGVAALLFIASIIGIGLMYNYFGGCGLTLFFISQTLIVGIIIVLIAQLQAFGGKLLPALVLFAHSTFLCWAAVGNSPDTECNDFADENSVTRIIIGCVIAAASVAWSSVRAAGSAYDSLKMDSDDDEKETKNLAAGIEMRGAPKDGAATATDTAAKKDEAVAAGRPAPPDVEEGVEKDPKEAAEEKEDVETRRKTVVFHSIMALAGLYMGMLMSNWGSAEGDGEPSANPEASDTAMWVKICTQWLTYVIFVWTLVAPKVCKGREFA